MKIKSVLVALIVSGLLPLSYAQKKEVDGRPFVSNAHLSIEVKNEKAPPRLGSPINMAVTVTNNESALVSWKVRTHHPAETIFRYKLSLKGIPVRTTALFRMLWNEQEQDDPPAAEVEDSILSHLEPGESVTYKLDLNDLFQITQLGVYTLEAERIASDEKSTIRSQPFTFTVLPH